MKFQFQCGAIGRSRPACRSPVFSVFQFQCGAIGRPIWNTLPTTQPGFNSSVVRLVDKAGIELLDVAVKFQFQCGAIGRSLC